MSSKHLRSFITLASGYCDSLAGTYGGGVASRLLGDALLRGGIAASFSTAST
ncbi:hypothetical protein N9D38_03795 [Rubripirellula sp.]|nr:hypothetical protein [Rubripirellula sp.]